MIVRLLGIVLAISLLCTVAVWAEDPPPAPEKGTTTGILVEKGKDWIRVLAEGDKEAVRYIPFWRGGMPQDGGGFDKATLETIAKIPVSNLVKVEWEVNEARRRIVSLTLVAPAEKAGTVTGVVTAKGENWLDMKPKDKPVERYMARWIGGAPKDGGSLDKAMIAAIAGVKVGDTVTLQWIYDERMRVIALQVVQPPTPPAEK